MDLTVFLLAGFGITTIITKSELFGPLREKLDNGRESVLTNFWGFLIICPMCVGFWIGLLLSFSLASPTYNYLIEGNSFNLSGFFENFVYYFRRIMATISDGSLVGGFAWTIHNLISLWDKKYDALEKEMEMNDSKELMYQLKAEEISRKNSK